MSISQKLIKNGERFIKICENLVKNWSKFGKKLVNGSQI